MIPALLAMTGAASAAGEPARDVIACDTLVSLRLLMAGSPSDHGAALASLPAHPGCRALARERVGAAEHRAMVGGSPFECLAIRDEGACAWVMP